jgi:hypothetical protein
MFARQRDAIGTLVTILAVPFSPISTRSAHLTVPGITFLDDLIPTQRIAVILRAFRAFVAGEQRFQRDPSVFTREGVRLVQCCLGEGFVRLNILNDAHREIFGIHAVERILTAFSSVQA